MLTKKYELLICNDASHPENHQFTLMGHKPISLTLWRIVNICCIHAQRFFLPLPCMFSHQSGLGDTPWKTFTKMSKLREQCDLFSLPIWKNRICSHKWQHFPTTLFKERLSSRSFCLGLLLEGSSLTHHPLDKGKPNPPPMPGKPHPSTQWSLLGPPQSVD